MNTQPRIAILFVCLGNICRSPLAEGVFRNVIEKRGIADRFTIDSAGTGAWHQGSAPDPRSIEVAARHGMDISRQRARQVTETDFARFDLILAMDRANLRDLQRRAPEGSPAVVALLTEFAESRGVDVPDPYYGGADGFERVYRMIRIASEALAGRLVDA